MGGEVALKGIALGVIHKIEAGAVRLNSHSCAKLRRLSTKTLSEARKSSEKKLACFMQYGRLNVAVEICTDKIVITVSTSRRRRAKGVSIENLISS